MVQLAKEDITTKEVFNWQGIHLLHFSGSTCSKKIRIMLEFKKIAWISHTINLIKRENYSEWFMGINPRGLVPVLVHDGQVHIESNDILNYLEKLFPEPPLMPKEHSGELSKLLKIEDDLHLDLRNLTMRFTAPSKQMQRSKEQLEHYKNSGTGRVCGELDSHKAEELIYWQNFAANNGITDAQVIESAGRFKQELDKLERRLEMTDYLLGRCVSLADISWFVTINRILLARYPVRRLHPGLWAWRGRLLKNHAFVGEAKSPFLQTGVSKLIWLRDKLKRQTLQDITRMKYSF